MKPVTLFCQTTFAVVFLSAIAIGISFANPAEEILANYRANADQVRKMEIEANLDVSRTYMRELYDTDKEDLQTYYGLAVEDQVYPENKELFFSGFASFEWNVVVDDETMNGTLKLKGAYANITTSNPVLEKNQTPERELHALSDTTSRFTISAPSSHKKSTVSEVLIPRQLAAFHYLPSLWYPNPGEIGMPKDLDAMKVKGGPNDPIAYFYTPNQLPSDLLAYLGRLCHDPNLQPNDLSAVLTIDRASYVCKYFAILKDFNGEMKTLLSITNVAGPQPNSGAGIVLPSKSILTSSISATGKKGTVWDTEYYCIFGVKSLMMH